MIVATSITTKSSPTPDTLACPDMSVRSKSTWYDSGFTFETTWSQPGIKVTG